MPRLGEGEQVQHTADPLLLEGWWVQVGSYAWRDGEINVRLSWLSSS